MRALLIALGVFGGATIISKMLSGGEGSCGSCGSYGTYGRSIGELGVGWRGHSNSGRPPAYWMREMDSSRARYLMSSKIRPWGSHTIDNI